jgi:thiosulfate/3-mercaptopyruvate sulfurtransferase
VIAPVVDPAWALAHRGGVVRADVRWYLDARSGAAADAQGHLPGAVRVDLDRWLAGPPGPAQGSHPLPDPAAFAAGMGRPVDAQPGHIPGARNVPFRGNLDGAGRFRPPEQLRQRFTAVRVGADSNVVSCCGSGVTACHNLLALELAGFAPGRLYAGSWSQ